MKKFNRTFLPEFINYNGKTYLRYLPLSATIEADGLLPIPHFSILVLVLCRRLKGRTDLHGRTYKPTKWIFSSIS